MNRRAYDNCKAKLDISAINKRLDLGKDKIQELSDNLTANNKEIMTNRKWDKLIFLMSAISLVINLIR